MKMEEYKQPLILFRLGGHGCGGGNEIQAARMIFEPRVQVVFRQDLENPDLAGDQIGICKTYPDWEKKVIAQFGYQCIPVNLIVFLPGKIISITGISD